MRTADPNLARRGRLSAIVLLSIMVLAGVVALSNLYEGITEDKLVASRQGLGLIGLEIVLAGLYLVNRRGYANLIGIILPCFMALTVFVVADPKYVLRDPSGGLVFAITVVLAGMISRPRNSFVMATLCVLGMAGLSWATTASLRYPSVEVISSLYMIALVTWLAAEGLENALRALHTLNQELDQRVRDRTRELVERTTELEQANARLQDMDQLKDDLLNQASHDLRTPLTALRALLQVVVENRVREEEKPKFLEMALGEVDRLGRLLNDLLDLRRLGAGQAVLNLRATDLPAVVESVLAGVRAAIAEKQLALHTDLPGDLPPVEADLDRLVQVLTNLLSNAVKYTPAGGTVTVRAAVAGPEVHIAVQDTGVGIPPEEQVLIFEPFHRASTAQGTAVGAGLGLAICKQIVERHRGRIWVESAPGQGSTFTFSLPAALVPPAVPVFRPTTGRYVLCVDDDPAIQRVFGEVLRQEGYEVLTAADGPTALRLACEIVPDVILLDLLLPGLRGEQVLVELRQDPATADIPVIVVSIVQEPGDGVWPLVADYLAKPVDLNRLVACVRRVLESAPPARTAAGEARRARVLVVDDDRATQVALSEALTAAGCQVLLAADGPAGLAAARQDRPDAILLDVVLGGDPSMDSGQRLDGWEVLRQLKTGELFPIPVIMMSGVVGSDARTYALQLGAVGFHRKPLDLAQLRAELRQLLDTAIK